jgi:hypothetical protein
MTFFFLQMDNMEFTDRDYAAKFADLQERILQAGQPLMENMWIVEQGEAAGPCQYSVHVSLHFGRISDQWWDVGARGAIAYASISELEPADLGAAVPGLPRRSDVRTRYSCTVYFFADGLKIYCTQGTRECYSSAAKTWLQESIRAGAGGGGGGAAAAADQRIAAGDL